MKKIIIALCCMIVCSMEFFAQSTDNIVYSWESPNGTPIETGGTIEYTNGEDYNRSNYPHQINDTTIYTICLNGKYSNMNDVASANAGHMVLRLNEYLQVGDIISITAYRYKNTDDKASTIYFLFENGSEWMDENSFVNICADEIDNDYDDDGNTPNTVTWSITEAEAGSKAIKMSRYRASTNLFITKIAITRNSEDNITTPNNPTTSEIESITPLTQNYVCVMSDYTDNYIGSDSTITYSRERGCLFGDNHFLDVSGGTIKLNKGSINIADTSTYKAINGADIESLATKYSNYGSHANTLRLKDTQDVIAFKPVTGSKIYVFGDGNKKMGIEARIPKFAKDAALTEALNESPDDFFPETNKFVYQFTVPEGFDGTVPMYIGSYNRDIFISFIVVDIYDYEKEKSIIAATKASTETQKIMDSYKNATDKAGLAIAIAKVNEIINVLNTSDSEYTIEDLNLAVASMNQALVEFEEENAIKVIESQGIIFTESETRDSYTITSYTTDLPTDVVIPSEIDGLPVTAIAANAFADATALKSITLPASVNIVGDKAFSGCHNLLQVEWNATAPLLAACFDSAEDYGNMLVFTSNADVNFTGNVVVNGTAQNITLMDGRPFYNPTNFTAKHISYRREFTKKTRIGLSGGWEGIILPFNVQLIYHEQKGTLKPFGTENTSALPFWMAEWQRSSTSFVWCKANLANQPFIMEVPNSEEYDNKYNIEGSVTFAAEGVTVYATTEIGQTTGNGYSLQGTYEGVSADSHVYALNDISYTAGNEFFLPGGVFVAESRDIRPFEAYIHNAQVTRSRYLPVQGGKANSMDFILLNSEAKKVDVYSLQGILIRKQIPIERIEKELPQGIYIVDGKKVVVK